MRLISRALAAVALTAALSAALAIPAPPAVADPATPAATPSAGSAAGAPVIVDAAPGAAPVPSLGTRAWVLADLDTGAILATRDADAQRPPASTLKLLTALAVVPRLAPGQPYRAVKADELAEGNRVVMYEGLKYTVADLLHAALLPSANDAAEALARANGGVSTTVDQMNAEAARLGATSTVAKNPSGLDAEGQVSTAHDLALIGRAALANPEIASYLALTEVDFPGKRASGKRVIYPIYNHNRMLVDGFDGALGGKSGYTSHAGRTFVGAAERDGHRLLVALLGISGNTYTTPERLLTWGFANYDQLQPVGQLEEPRAPAPQFDRAVTPLPARGASATPAESRAQRQAPDAPTASEGASSWGLPGLPVPPLPSPLTLLTLAMGVVVLLRARVYWIAHRNRAAWVDLEVWARQQARSARRRSSGPAGAGADADDTAAHQAAGAVRVEVSASGAPRRSPT